MKKLLSLVIVLTLLLISAPVFAKGKNGPAGNSNKAHLYLYEKSGDPDWEIVEGGAWGKMTYDLSGKEFNFVFNGHSLKPEVDYTLIYYPDPWPGKGLICLGSGFSDEYGDIHIQNSKITGDLPADTDNNYSEYGAKIWLVLSDDVS